MMLSGTPLHLLMFVKCVRLGLNGAQVAGTDQRLVIINTLLGCFLGLQAKLLGVYLTTVASVLERLLVIAGVWSIIRECELTVVLRLCCILGIKLTLHLLLVAIHFL